jgi:hypothetical protein
MEQPAAGNVTHKPRRGSGDARLLDACFDVVEHRGGIPALLREFGLELLRERLVGWQQAWRVLDPVEE